MDEKRKATPDDVRQLLKSVEIFAGLTTAHLRKVVATGEVTRLERRETLFQPGDPADRVHLVIDGAIEIVRATPDHPEPVPVAYISPGELIGDMALFTGSQRQSGGRAPEFAEVWTLTRKAFDRLVKSIPGYGMELARIFACRLEDFISHMRRQAGRKELAGRLRFFDLPTVVQTLVTSGQTGVLTILDEQGRRTAEVLLRDGAVDRARCGTLEGEEAFYEIFLRGDEGEFVFRTVSEVQADGISARPIALTAMNLLIEAMRLKDELPRVRERVGEKAYRAGRKKLTWDDEATAPIAREVFARLKKAQPIADLVGELPCSTLTVYEVAAALIESGQIK